MSDTIADQVAERERELMGDESNKMYDAVIALGLDFVRDCFNANERGDGLLLAALLYEKYLYVTTPDKKGEWYRWDGHIWEFDEYDSCYNMVEYAAIAYEEYALDIEEKKKAELEELAEERETKIAEIKSKYGDEDAKIKIEKLLKKPLIPSSWMDATIKSYRDRAWKLRGKNKMSTVLFMAPRVDDRIATVTENLDQKEWLLPAKQGVIDLQRGILVDGRPDDLLTKRIDVAYRADADYRFWQDIVDDTCIDPANPSTKELPRFLKRFFGSAITGKINEEFLAVFLGPGRNGKGTILGAIADVLGPYYHEANRSLFIEQKNEPPPSATSEHMYALLGKRLVVGAETNKGQKIDGGLIKKLTGGNKINYRRNYSSEKIANATHTLVLETNNIPYGLTKEFSLVQRLLLIELSYRYVDDIEEEEKKYPALKGKFKQKDSGLKDKLKSKENREGILRWLVEGCLEWQEHGLDIPDCILESRGELMKKEDHLGQFLIEVMEHCPDQENMTMKFGNFYKAFEYYWKEYIDESGAKKPSKKTISKWMRERGYLIEKIGGDMCVRHFKVRDDVALSVEELLAL
ncbi:DNA primase family protein [Desulforhopalus singaporensis]|uniref:Putative DNA primase/helicase n=1 Tax=Desulforhopalus singaporensis TaxID=91360 RepID=A0A1H0NQT4_9BACT|nr:phage/plasmid primase, P4 family [Desulforhopalus singaporensis]SDO95152.1 putative DNA primase/helicase [Desulforhopalus singaporensis]